MSWQWEDVWNDYIQQDEGSDIPYFVLFVYEELIETEDSVWDKIKLLTRQSLLGFRAAISPGKISISDGGFDDHYTIILDVPNNAKDDVRENLQSYNLWQYVRQWKSRIRFSDREHPHDASHTLIETYPFEY